MGKLKCLHNFWTDRDISKIWKVLNSAYHKEQAVEVLQKSVNFSFFVIKGLSQSEPGPFKWLNRSCSHGEEPAQAPLYCR